MHARLAPPLALAAAALAAACGPDPMGYGLKELPNAAKADRAALLVPLMDAQPRSFYLTCEAEEGCDISLAAELRAPDLCELASPARACDEASTGGLQVPVATLSLETPAGDVFERTVIAASGEDGAVRTILEQGEIPAQPPGTYFVDLQRAPELDRAVELVLEAGYGPGLAPEPEPACDLGRTPELLGSQTSGDRRWVALRWKAGDASWLGAEGEAFEVSGRSLLARYRDEVAGAGIDTDPIALLSRQREMYERVAPDHVPTFDAIMAGDIGEIGAVGCWEAAVMEDHLRRHAEQRVPNEFQAFLLTRGEGEDLRARVYSISGDATAAPPTGPLMEQLEADLDDGWQMRSHIHNHFFFLAHLPDGDIAGTLIPSPPDRNLYVEHADTYGLAEARISNAFDTIRFPRAEFDELLRLLESH